MAPRKGQNKVIMIKDNLARVMKHEGVIGYIILKKTAGQILSLLLLLRRTSPFHVCRYSDSVDPLPWPDSAVRSSDNIHCGRSKIYMFHTKLTQFFFSVFLCL